MHLTANSQASVTTAASKGTGRQIAEARRVAAAVVAAALATAEVTSLRAAFTRRTNTAILNAMLRKHDATQASLRLVAAIAVAALAAKAATAVANSSSAKQRLAAHHNTSVAQQSDHTDHWPSHRSSNSQRYGFMLIHALAVTSWTQRCAESTARALSSI